MKEKQKKNYDDNNSGVDGNDYDVDNGGGDER